MRLTEEQIYGQTEKKNYNEYIVDQAKAGFNTSSGLNRAGSIFQSIFNSYNQEQAKTEPAQAGFCFTNINKMFTKDFLCGSFKKDGCNWQKSPF